MTPSRALKQVRGAEGKPSHRAAVMLSSPLVKHPHANTALPQGSEQGALAAANHMMLSGGKNQQGSPPGQKQV